MTLLVVGFAQALMAEPLAVYYPEDPNSNLDRASSGKYMRDLLRIALDNAGVPHLVSSVEVGNISESRSQLYLKAGKYNVHWLMTSPEKEQQLLPVRIPLYKGLIGWRLLFVTENNRQMFRDFNSLQHIQHTKACLGHDWPDVAILRSAGFKVKTPINVGILDVLKQGRCDYFPRSIMEIWNEQATAKAHGVTVEPYLAIHYPAAYYFFVSPENTALAGALEKGLLVSLANGSFDEHFYAYFGEDIKKSNLSARKIIEVANPNFKREQKPNQASLWFKP